MGVLERPWAAAFLAALFVASGPLSAAPLVLRSMFQILLLVPLIRLIRPRISPRLVPSLYIAAILFAVDGVRQSIVDAPALAQILLVLEAIAAASALAHSLRAGVFRRDSASPAFRAAAGLALTALVVALVAGGLGYTPVGRLLASAVLGSAVLALTLYASVQVVAGVVALALHVWPLRLLQMVQHHRDLLERRARVVLAWLAVALWVFRTLEYMALYEPASLVLASVLGTKVGRGEIQISVRDILEFVLTVVFAYLVSAFIRFVLREDVYPHTQMSRGLTYAVSSLLNYVILAFGFVVALGALGVRLDRLTVLAGAFGVGIGFGLQSVVNNFVSGLILLFERPVHVGDIIEVGSLSGEVSRIGIRASTVRTWQGAEIIVPNAQFVTQQVTNWTLSDRTRRIDMPVGVDYGSPPDKVIEVLVAVARKHPEIMRTPAPQAVFKGFGDSSINFELRAWTNRFERWPNIQTELAAGVYAALHAAGMSLPFPQREVRLLGEAPRGPKAP